MKDKLAGKPPIICLDFDGVLHSFHDGWKGPRAINEPPVPGAITWLYDLLHAIAMGLIYFEVDIYSCRSKYWGGRKAMRNWLIDRFRDDGYNSCLIELIKFPLFKPPPHIMIDDHGISFDGTFPTIKELKKFKPWYERNK